MSFFLVEMESSISFFSASTSDILKDTDLAVFVFYLRNYDNIGSMVENYVDTSRSSVDNAVILK